MKILRLALAALVLLGMASCQKENFGEGEPRDGKVLCQINVGIEDLVGENTRALSEETTSAKGGLTNVDFDKYDLRYIISVYDKEGENVIVNRVIQTLDSYAPTTFNLRLSPNKEYKFVVWADFVKQGETEDLHYKTCDLKYISCIDAREMQLNDESRDAFTQVQDVELKDEGKSIDIVLRRPFAKIRMVATDWNTEEGPANLMPDSIEITYYGGKEFYNYNAINGTTGSSELHDLNKIPEWDVKKISIDPETKYYKKGYDATPANRTLMVDYLMTDKSEQTFIHLKFEAYKNGKLLRTHDFNNNIPIQRNYLTTLLGNLLTVNTQVNVSIDENFIGEYNGYWFEAQGFTPKEPASHEEGNYKKVTVYEISTPEELMYLSKKMGDGMGEGAFTIKLCSDIDMKGVEWMPMSTYTHILFDGQGHTMRNFNIKTIMKNTNTNINETWMSNYATGVFGNWNGVIRNLTIENVTINVPEDSNSDSPYIGGVVGNILAGMVEDVHVKHVFIKSPSQKTTIGGLIGKSSYSSGNPQPFYKSLQTRWNMRGIYNTQINNCSATDVHISGGNRVGGLIGQLINGNPQEGGYGYGNGVFPFLKGCSTDYIYLRLYSGIEDVAVSPFIGRHEGYDANIQECTPAVHFEIVDAEGESLMDSYQPYSEYIGKVEE